ncbi:uncharacterized protein LOC116254932 isoform X2 [Nymphaea colorata]|uniref:uncharacterized protein LOC116254932 isoform X2 n=1 Tax=Nymphaea colorata TaxID=210225 RepID=UPI00129E824F|nr:uncharacterized protein LOC116254932 isoform X2 [Nymphaea colorata]
MWVATGREGNDGLSLESEQDLDILVRDFVESGCGGEESWCSSDSDSGTDLSKCAKKIYSLRHSADQLEDDLSRKIRMLVLSIGETDLRHKRANPCNCSCVRWSLVKLLRLSGYNASICTSKWEASGKVPGGDHEYIDVILSGNSRSCERIIIEIDFRSHFEIARATESYDAMLNALPVIYVGTFSRLKQFLQAMVDAGKFSLKQNSMSFPPWRSLTYLQSKWQSVRQRKGHPDDQIGCGSCFDNGQCVEDLRRLKVMLQSEAEIERLFKPIIRDGIGRERFDGRRRPVYVS